MKTVAEYLENDRKGEILMIISMALLATYLRRYQPVSTLAEDRMQISGVRYLSDPRLKLSRKYVYVGDAISYFGEQTYEGASILVNDHSWIICHGCNREELLNDVLGAFEYYNNWEHELRIASAEGAGLPCFMKIVEEVVEDPMFLFDLNGRLLTGTSSALGSRELLEELDIRDGVMSVDTLGRRYISREGRLQRDLQNYPTASYEESRPDFWAVNMYLTSEQERLGFLMIFPEDSVRLEQALQLEAWMQPFLLKSEEFSVLCQARRSGTSVIRDLLEQKPVGEYAMAQLERQIREKSPWVLLTVRNLSIQNHTHRLMIIREVSALPVAGIAVEYEEEVLILTARRQQEGILEALREKMHLVNSRICISLPFYDLEQLYLSYRQTRLVTEPGETPGVFACQTFALAYLLTSLNDKLLNRTLLHPAVGILQAYDRENQTALLETLKGYLQNHCIQADAAQQLYIHRNTLKYRLARIRELTQTDLENPQERLYLELSLAMYQDGKIW